MNKKIFLPRLFVLVCLIIALFFGIYLSNVNKSLNLSNECIMLNNACSFSTATMNLRIKFQQAPVIEEELLLNVDISTGHTITGAWVEGVNMYMGKTPVIFTNTDGKTTNNGITFLGSCTQPDMQWKLYIQVQDEAEKTEVYSATFSTQIN